LLIDDQNSNIEKKMENQKTLVASITEDKLNLKVKEVRHDLQEIAIKNIDEVSRAIKQSESRSLTLRDEVKANGKETRSKLKKMKDDNSKRKEIDRWTEDMTKQVKEVKE
jgi:hypothetical protein